MGLGCAVKVSWYLLTSCNFYSLSLYRTSHGLKGGPQYRPQETIIRIIGTSKVALTLGNA